MKIGGMNNPSLPVFDELSALAAAKFDFLDLTLEGPNATHVDANKMRALLDRSGMSVTGHTDPCLPYAYPIQGVRDACLKELERCAGIFSKLGATVMNIHPCYFMPPSMKSAMVALNTEALKPIVEMAASYGLTLVIENFTAPFDRVSTFEKMLSEVPGLKLHLDFGHTNIGRDDYEVFCSRLGADIKHVHFSDNRSRYDDHMPLGVGTIDWNRAVTALQKSGYDATITLEVFSSDPGMRFKYLNLSRQLVLDAWG